MAYPVEAGKDCLLSYGFAAERGREFFLHGREPLPVPLVKPRLGGAIRPGHYPRTHACGTRGRPSLGGDCLQRATGEVQKQKWTRLCQTSIPATPGFAARSALERDEPMIGSLSTPLDAQRRKPQITSAVVRGPLCVIGIAYLQKPLTRIASRMLIASGLVTGSVLTLKSLVTSLRSRSSFALRRME